MANFRTKTKTGPPSPLVRTRPFGDVNFTAFSAEAERLSAYVHRDVLAFIERESRRIAPDEAIGLLAGRTCHDPERGLYTLVMAAEGARCEEVEASPSHVYISAAGNASVRRRLEASHPDREIIGWYHSHPHHPARFSHIDIAEQSTWGDPNHIGIVFSGTQKDEPFCVYAGPNAIQLSPRPHPQVLPPSRLPNAARVMPPPPEHDRVDRRERNRREMKIMRHERAGRESRGRGVNLLRTVALIATLCLLAIVVWLHLRLNSLESALSVVANSASKSAAPVTAETPPQTQPARLTEAASEVGDRTTDQPQLVDAPIIQPAAKSLIAPQKKTTAAGRAERDDASVGARRRKNRNSDGGTGNRTERTRGATTNSRPGKTTTRPRPDPKPPVVKPSTPAKPPLTPPAATP